MAPASAAGSVLSPVEEIVAEIRAGRIVVLVDEEDRENEGDLVVAAEHCTPEAINFMARFGRGLICLTLTQERCRQLGLKQMVTDNQTPHGTAFTVSIEAAEGVTTGISAHDRSHTVRTAAARGAKPTDLVMPGHIFPLAAQPGGVLVRAGHTEAGCDLAQMAGLEPASVICEIMNDDGTMARLPELIEFAKVHGLKIGAISDLIHYRSEHETLVERVASRQVDTPHGVFVLHAFADRVASETHFALVFGDPATATDPVVRVHEPVSVLDFLDPGALRHSVSVGAAQRAIANAGAGVIVLLHRPQTGADLLAAFRGEGAGSAQATKKWDPRLYGIGAQILRDLGVRRMRLLGSPRKMPSMTGFDLEVVGFVSPKELEKH
jgi:3,4-dihydroxy 2-butanone 4-phosphate synthase / GTP cyclohydrolase II